MAEHRCGELKLQLLKPLVLGWIKLLQKHLARKRLRAALSLSLCGKINDMLFFFFLFSLLMWSIDIQPGTHQCHALSLGTLHWITPLGAQNSNLCGQCASQPLSWHFTFIPPPTLFGAIQNIKECRRSQLVVLSLDHSFTKSAMCTLGTTMEQCCPCLVLRVLSGGKGCDKVHLLLSEVLPGSHILLSHPSAAYPPLSFFSFFSPVGWKERGEKWKQKPLSKRSTWFRLWFWVFYSC